MPSIAVRISDYELTKLKHFSEDNVSKYVRDAIAAFIDAKCRAESLEWLENRVGELLENQDVLLATVRALAAEVSELKAAPPPQAQPIAAPAQDNSRLEGMTLELLLLLRGRASNTERQQIHAMVECEGLPVWESSRPPSSSMASNAIERQPQAEVERPITSLAKEDRSFISKAKGWLG
jgi:hypothetical protein